MSDRVLVALSGGLDSAAVVLMLARQGFDVQALYIDMTGDAMAGKQAREVASKLGFIEGKTFHIENVVSYFDEQIIQHTLSEHSVGRTPSPCVRCNPMIKWQVLSRVADRLGIPLIATGHYVNIVEHGGHFFVSRGVDPSKDQSYYLWSLGQDILARALTPLGTVFKGAVRDYLSGRGFGELSASRESMGVCFLGGCSYVDFLRTHLQPAPRMGEVIDCGGRVVGFHQGVQLYTIGQKRGFSSSIGGEIREIDPLSNRLIVGEPLLVDQLVVGDYVLHEDTLDDISVCVRGLGRNPQGRVHIERSVSGLELIVSLLDDRAWAPAAGQPVVFYSGDRVVGGGFLSARGVFGN